MSRNVDDAEAEVVRKFQVREAEFDGDAAGLLLFEAVRVDARQRLYQRGLAMVNVPGGAEYQMLHQGAP